jgi:hypothetical protein
MSLEKLLAITTCIKEAKSVAAALSLPPDSIPDTQKVQLLELLDRAQQLTVALRADFIDLAYFRSLDEDRRAASAESPSKEPGGQPGVVVFPFERRRAGTDRRRVQTFLACDRRSGVADRRR